ILELGAGPIACAPHSIRNFAARLPLEVPDAGARCSADVRCFAHPFHLCAGTQISQRAIAFQGREVESSGSATLIEGFHRLWHGPVSLYRSRSQQIFSTVAR